MHRVYLLLRNNHEYGPFTIDELRQQDVSSGDLIWVEGRSSAWAYPSELEELTFLSKAGSTPCSKPAGQDKGEIEERAEELRKRALSYTPQAFYPHPFQEEEGKYRSIVLPGEENIDVIYHRRRGANLSQYAAAAMLTVLLGLGWYQRGLIFNARTWESKPSVEARIVTSESHLAKPPRPEAVQPVQAAMATLVDSVPLPEPTVAAALYKKERSHTPVIKVEDRQLIMAEPAAITQAVLQSEIKKTEPETAVAPPQLQPALKTEAAETALNEEESGIEKKKGLGRALKGLFKKKKKDEDKISEIPVAETGNG